MPQYNAYTENFRVMRTKNCVSVRKIQPTRWKCKHILKTVCVHVSHQHKHVLMLTWLVIHSTPAPSKLQTMHCHGLPRHSCWWQYQSPTAFSGRHLLASPWFGGKSLCTGPAAATTAEVLLWAAQQSGSNALSAALLCQHCCMWLSTANSSFNLLLSCWKSGD